MPVIAVVCFLVSLILLVIALLLSLPQIPPDPGKPWRGLPFLLGMLFFVLAEFFSKGGLP